MRTESRLGWLRRFVTQPLTLSQVASSLAGAAGTLIAAAAMPSDQFLAFSLISLASITASMAARAGLFQPALIELRTRPNAHVPFRNALIAAGVLSATATAVILTLVPLTGSQAVLLLVSGVFPVLHDWVRFRAMSVEQRWWVLVADGGRLVLVVIGSVATVALTTDAVTFQVVQGLAYAVPALVVLPRLRRVTGFEPLRNYSRAAGLQLGDYAIGQFYTTVPLLVLGGLGATGTIAGVRLAQTLLGPLGLVFSASTINLLADSASDADLKEDLAVYRAGERLANTLGLLSVAVIGGLAALLWVSGAGLRGVAGPDLLNGVLLVGVSMASSGWAGIHAILLRLLDRQGIATAGRAALVACSSAGFAVGYFVGGVDGSLVGGFVVAALANPLAFVVPSLLVHRKILAANGPDAELPA